MSKLTDLPVVTSLDDADLIYAVDVSDTTDDPAGSSVAITKDNFLTDGSFDMPVVQSATFESDGTVLFSSESGWSATKTGTGVWQITFPTAASSIWEQSITAIPLSDGASTTDTSFKVQELTATTCVLEAYVSSNGTNLDRQFSIQRRLPDTSVANKVIVPSRAGEVVKEEIARITATGQASFEFNGLDVTGYDKLIMHGALRGDAAVEITGLRLFLNGDETESNYYYQANAGDNGTSSVSESANAVFGLLLGATAVANSYSQLDGDIPFPADTNMLRTYNSHCCGYYISTQMRSGGGSASHKTMTAAINALKFVGTSGLLSGTIILYGERTL